MHRFADSQHVWWDLEFASDFKFSFQEFCGFSSLVWVSIQSDGCRVSNQITPTTVLLSANHLVPEEMGGLPF